MDCLGSYFCFWKIKVLRINETLDKRKERRMSTQPWNKPSAGSVFRNPEGAAAWKYIDDAGLRGYEIAEHKFLQNILYCK